MIDEVAWWKAHKNSEGMDPRSKRILLEGLRSWNGFYNQTRQSFDKADMPDFDQVFGEDQRLVQLTIAEIEASLVTVGNTSPNGNFLTG